MRNNPSRQTPPAPPRNAPSKRSAAARSPATPAPRPATISFDDAARQHPHATTHWTAPPPERHSLSPLIIRALAVFACRQILSATPQLIRKRELLPDHRIRQHLFLPKRAIGFVRQRLNRSLNQQTFPRA